MSRITFLDNAHNGKNNWWMYLLTIILTWGGGKTLAMISPIFIYNFFYFLIVIGLITANQVNTIVSNPLFELIITGIIYTLLFFIFYLCIRFIHQKAFISIINTVSKVNWQKIMKGAGIWLIIMAFVTLISLIINPKGFEVTFNPNNFVYLLILSIIVFSIQAPLEELFFRGYLMQGMSLITKKPVIPLIATSAIFAALHYGNGTDIMISVILVIHAFIFGMTMGIIVLGENRLETAMGMHIADNFFPAVIANNPYADFANLPSIITIQVAPNVVMDTFTYTLVSIVILVAVFWNKKENVYNIFRTKQ